jgi:GNAT superfamily N-acetyltransferase
MPREDDGGPGAPRPPAPRLACAADVAALVRLINAAYRVEDFFVHGDRTGEADVRAHLDTRGGCFLVLDGEAPGELAGAVYVEVRGDRGYFGMLSVDPGRQRQGLGRLLAAAAEAHCRTAGCQVLDIDVIDLRRELPAFYAALGFEPAGVGPFPDPDKLRRPAHVVVMSKRLGPPADLS